MGTLGIAVLGWFIRLERRLGEQLTRAEHEKLCTDRNEEITQTLSVIRDDVREIRSVMMRSQ